MIFGVPIFLIVLEIFDLHVNKKPHCVSFFSRLSIEVKSLDPDDIAAHETFLETYKNTLHRNHHYNLWVKHSLAQMYGKVGKYLLGICSYLFYRQTVSY